MIGIWTESAGTIMTIIGVGTGVLAMVVGTVLYVAGHGARISAIEQNCRRGAEQHGMLFHKLELMEQSIGKVVETTARVETNVEWLVKQANGKVK